MPSPINPPAIINQAYEIVPVDQLRVHPRNANQGDMGAIHESISENGFFGAVIAQRSTGYVLAGNHRLMSAEVSGIVSLPVIWVDVDDERALRILLADNRTTRLGNDDPAKLAGLLTELAASSSSLAGTGYDREDLDELMKDLAGNAAVDPTHTEGDASELVPSGVCPHCGKAISIKK